MTDQTDTAIADQIEPEVLPWAAEAIELGDLAKIAQDSRLNREQGLRALLELPAEIARSIADYDALHPPVEPPVVEPPTVPPEPITPDPPMFELDGKIKREKYPPGAARTLTATAASLQDVVDNKAQPGDHVVCEGGGYDREYIFTKAFPPEQKVVIRSKTPLETNFTKPLQFKAPGYFLHECRSSFSVPAQPAIYLDASHVFITRCWIQGHEGIYGAHKAIGNVQIGWNRFTGQNKTNGSGSHIFMWLPFSGSYTKTTDGPHRMSIHRNFFDDPASKAMEDHSIYFGHSKAGPKDAPMGDFYIDYNFWAATCSRKRPLYLKRGGVVRRNTCLSTERNFGVRHGMKSVFWANTIRTSFFHFSGAMLIGGTPENYHDIRGNDAPNATMVLWCGSGTEPPYQAASYATAAGNKVASIAVGLKQKENVSAAHGGLTKGCRIFLDGRIPRSAVSLQYCVKDTITIRDDDGGMVIPKTDPLTEEMVGLETKGQGA